jgi:hypothetical protein
MTSGIYLEVPLGEYYDETKRYGARENVKKIFGIDARFLRKDVLDNYIINGEEGNTSQHPGIYQIISRKFGRLLASLPYDDASGKTVTRGYKNRTGDLIRSSCFGIFRNGKLRRMYRFTGGKLDGMEPTEYEESIGMTEVDVQRLMNVSISHGYHPDPSERAQSFLQGYKLKEGSRGFTLVYATTMPYAVFLEKRSFAPIRVMEGIRTQLEAMAAPLRTSGKGTKYGYIFD